MDSIAAKDCDYLYLDQSQLPGAGLGLFTSINIFTDEVICLFFGEIINEKEAERRSALGRDAYFIDLNDGTTMDCGPIDGKAKYANDASGYRRSRFNNNSLITFDDDDRVCLAAKRDIKKGEEIFCAYGKDYWKKFRAENKTKKRVEKIKVK